MFPLLLKPLAANLWSIGRVVLPLAVAGYLGYDLGHGRASLDYQAGIASLKASHAESAAQQAAQAAANLAAADARYRELNQQAHVIGAELLQTRADLAASQRQLKQRITHVTQSDGERFTGLGPDSLQLYRAALGYTAADVAADLPATHAGTAAAATETATTEAGLPPVDLLHHASDYGQWCQQLEGQLQAFIRLHQEAASD